MSWLNGCLADGGLGVEMIWGMERVLTEDVAELAEEMRDVKREKRGDLRCGTCHGV